MNDKKKKLILINGVIFIALMVLVGIIIMTLLRIRTQRDYEALAAIKNSEDSKTLQTEVIPTESIEETEATTEPPYVYQANENTKWLAINPDYFGWLKIPGTNIDYPYVRSDDNVDYLDLDFYRNPSEAGALFMDYRNLGNFNDQHTLIYGHYMKNKSMFHNLTNYHSAEYFYENQRIEISGLYDEKTYLIFSVYEISADDYTFTLDFDTDEAYSKYLDGLSNLSMHAADFEIDPTQPLLTLVTCSYGVGNGRTIVHAVALP